jgi:type I restriction enzyme S subunit
MKPEEKARHQIDLLLEQASWKVQDYQSLKQSERLRQSILKRAFEGKLVPQNPTDEPESVLLERIKLKLNRQSKDGKSKIRTHSRNRWVKTT